MRLPAKNAILLFLAALIWGTAFVAQSVGMDYVGPFTFNACRYVIGSAVLFPLILLGKRRTGGKLISRDDLRAGMACGFFLAVASNLQQAGIMTTDVGKAGFLTAMYIVIVPVLHFFLTRRSSLRLWISAAIAAAGLYFLSISGLPAVPDGSCPVLGGRPADRDRPVGHHPAGGPGHSLCRRLFLRRGLYPADHRTERGGPGSGFPDPVSGVRRIGRCRLSFPGTGPDGQGTAGLRPDVRRHCAGAAS